MHRRLPLTTLCCAITFWQAAAGAQDIDQELSNLADKLSAAVKAHDSKKVTVLDFTDLQGSPSGELGKYIAEQLTVDLVMAKRDFAVLDRANLKSILAEHKLTATGLVNPANAKKLGQFAGVDALILGSIVPKPQNVMVIAKIITTDTAEVVGAARAEFRADTNVRQLMSTLATNTNEPSDTADEPVKPARKYSKYSKSIGTLLFTFESLRIVNGQEYSLTMSITNKSRNKTICTMLKEDGAGGSLTASLTDPEGYEFHAPTHDTSGLGCGYFMQFLGTQGQFSRIDPGTASTGTIKFSVRGRSATPGKCRIQVGVFLADLDGYGKLQNLRQTVIMGDMEVE